MAIVANIDAYFADRSLEHRVAEIAGLKKEFFVVAVGVGNMNLAELAEITAVGVDHRGGVVIDASHLFFIDRDYQNHAVLFSYALHMLHSMAPNSYSKQPSHLVQILLSHLLLIHLEEDILYPLQYLLQHHAAHLLVA